MMQTSKNPRNSVSSAYDPHHGRGHARYLRVHAVARLIYSKHVEALLASPRRRGSPPFL